MENYISQNEGEYWVGFQSVSILEAHGGHNALESSLALITDRNTQKWHHSINCNIVAGLLCYPPIPVHPQHLISFLKSSLGCKRQIHYIAHFGNALF